MPKKIQITVKEELSELKSLLRNSKSDRQRGRLKCLILLKQGKFCYQSKLASKLGFTEKTVRDWLKSYSTNGLNDFIAIKVGGNNTRHLSDECITYIADKLLDSNTTVTSYIELQALIEQELGEQVNYGALYAHCRRKHKSKLKVSRKSHYKKDPAAEAVFKKP